MSTSASPDSNQPAQTNSTAPDPMAAALRQAASQVDHGMEATDDAILQASAKEKEGQSAADNSGKDKTSEGKDNGADTDPAGKTGDGKEGTTDKDKDKAKGDKQPGEQKQDSPEEKEKKRKDDERRERSWQEFNRKQEEFKQQRAELERRERELEERERGGEQRRTGPVKDSHGYTAEQYDKAATDWEAKGNYELADLAKEAAAKLRAQEKGETEHRRPAREDRPNTPPDQTPGSPEFREKWNGHLAELRESEEYKDLGNKESELFKSTAGILHQEPRLSKFNDGIRIAAEIAKLRIEAGSASALKTKLEEATKELEKLRKATTPGSGGGESRGAASKPFEEMSGAEQAAHLKRAAAEVDG